MGQPVAAAAFWASHNKPIWRVSADPVGQPVRQNHEFLNRLFIPPLDFQALLHRFGAVSLAIGWQWIALVLYFIVFGLIGVVVGQRKGRAFAGFVFGALLGPIGWLIVALGPDVK